ncbi:MAG: hypothetical protein ACXVRE_06065 [Gaiellaceae bacterium]
MALLLILLALFGFVLAGIGSSSTSITPARKAPPAVTKCSKHMHAEPASSRCRPPANP